MTKYRKILLDPIFNENPIARQILGICSALAVTSKLETSVVMALAVALAQPVEVSKQDAPAVVMLADLSDSMSTETRDRMEDKLEEFWSERGEAATFLVGFG